MVINATHRYQVFRPLLVLYIWQITGIKPVGGIGSILPFRISPPPPSTIERGINTREKSHFMGGNSLASDSSPLHPWHRGEGGTLHTNYPTLPGGTSLPLDYAPLLPVRGVDLIPRVKNY